MSLRYQTDLYNRSTLRAVKTWYGTFGCNIENDCANHHGRLQGTRKPHLYTYLSICVLCSILDTRPVTQYCCCRILTARPTFEAFSEIIGANGLVCSNGKILRR